MEILVTIQYDSIIWPCRIFSVTERTTFEKVDEFREQILRIQTNNSPSKYSPQNTQLILVGNKCDLSENRQVSHEEANEKAKSWNNCRYFETSAKENINVEEVFQEIVENIQHCQHHRKKSKLTCVLF
eukprot:Sdes_comp19322_c0_seq2m10476